MPPFDEIARDPVAERQAVRFHNIEFDGISSPPAARCSARTALLAWKVSSAHGDIPVPSAALEQLRAAVLKSVDAREELRALT